MSSEKTKKQVTLIVQGRRETGKTILAFICGEKYRDAKIVDVDRSNKTISTYLAYRKPVELSFLDSTGFPSKELFRQFFVTIAGYDEQRVICDFGSEESQFLPDLLEEDAKYGDSIIEYLNIELHILVVVAGHYLFPACMEYLHQLTETTGCAKRITAFKNEFYSYNTELNRMLQDYCQNHHVREGVLVSLVATNNEMILSNFN